jgi:hypothetical protein
MARVADRSFVAVWRDRIERQQRRGLSIQAFCQEEGVAQGTFYAWKRRGKAEGQALHHLHGLPLERCRYATVAVTDWSILRRLSTRRVSDMDWSSRLAETASLLTLCGLPL